MHHLIALGTLLCLLGSHLAAQAQLASDIFEQLDERFRCAIDDKGKSICSVGLNSEIIKAAADLRSGFEFSTYTEGGRASRIFAGPGEFPPNNFGAYAILAFKSSPTVHDYDRYKFICEAYASSIPFSLQGILPENQLVTVWPISKKSEEIFAIGHDYYDIEKTCQTAVSNYGLVLALEAIRDARIVSDELTEEIATSKGPFLFAWNPASKKGASDALILRMDLSDVEHPYQAKRRFELWVQKIESNPGLWQDDWENISLLKRIGEVIDNLGPVADAINIFGGDK